MNTKFQLKITDVQKRMKESLSSLKFTMPSPDKQPNAQDGASTTREVNSIMKGSKLIGDIKVTHDLELSGDVEGNISSDKNSNIVIKGNCHGNITTREGNVDIEGAVVKGDITAGGSVKVTGQFSGGEIVAKEKIYINGDFSGTLRSNEIEVGPSSRGTGELFYKEHISIHKGADVDVQIRKIDEAQTAERKSTEKKIIDFETPTQKKG